MPIVEPPVFVSVSRPARTPGRTVGFETLGCKVNTFETELLAQSLRDINWDVADAGDTADVFIINTCTVTGEADRQARQLVRRIVRRNPNALVVVTGCYAQVNPRACARIPGVDLVVGNDRKLDLDRILLERSAAESPQVLVGDVSEHLSLPSGLVDGLTGHSRAFVQVQQGCDQGCTFCVIHRARGPSRSLAPALIKRQVERLVSKGYGEIVLCGIDLGAYGLDMTAAEGRHYRLSDLLLELGRIAGDFRVRLSSIDPAHLDDGLIDALDHCPKLCPHLHLSLQSGNTLILKRMKRRYSANEVYARVAALRDRIPDLVLSADLMVGFPTETDPQYRDTERMVRDLAVAFPHVFCYSDRPGTPAARIPVARQVPPIVRKQRAARLRRAAKRIRDDLLVSRLGRVERVLVEAGGRSPHGYQRARAADYLVVHVPAASGDVGQWRTVKYSAIYHDGLIARPAV